MFENVLVGVDGSPHGRDAVALAHRLTDPSSRVALVHVHPGELRPSHAVVPGMLKEEREAAEQLLKREAASAKLPADLVSVVAGSPGRGLHELAEEREADLIVVGSSSHGPLGRVLLGDDSRAALNGAPCAVAIAAAGYAERDHPFANLGVAYDGSPESEVALATARDLAQVSHARVHALEVVPIVTWGYGPMAPLLLNGSFQAMVTEADARMKELPGVEGRAVDGLAGEELAAFGDELDLLIAGSRGYGPVRRLVLGSTSRYLQRHARCSLLVLPRGVASAKAARHESHADEGKAVSTAA